MTDSPPLPHFVVIGAQKSATRWLRINLGRHPEIFTAERELHFWNSPGKVNSTDGISRYREMFSEWRGEAFVGEATPGYMIWRHHPWRTARLMATHIPSVRPIAILRNPIDRAQSALRHHARRKRIPPDARLVEVLRERQPFALDRLCLVSAGWYGASLRPFQQTFGEQLLVLLHDDVAAEPVRVFEAAVSHIGASSGFVPEAIGRVVFGGGTATQAGLTPDERVEVWQYFRKDVERLEAMLGRDLSLWDPTRERHAGDPASRNTGEV